MSSSLPSIDLVCAVVELRADVAHRPAQAVRTGRHELGNVGTHQRGVPMPTSAQRAFGHKCSTRSMLGSLISDGYKSGPGSALANR